MTASQETPVNSDTDPSQTREQKQRRAEKAHRRREAVAEHRAEHAAGRVREMRAAESAASRARSC